MINLTNDEIQTLIESIGGNMNHIGELDGKIVPMNNSVGLLHCIDDLMLINQQRDRIAELEREKAELVAQLKMIRKIFRSEDLSQNETAVALQKLASVIDMLPEQCLNQIKAEAVQDAANKLAKCITTPHGMHSSAVSVLIKMSDRIRKGG